MNERHKVREIDRDAKTGVCSVCGPIRIHLKNDGQAVCWTVRVRNRHGNTEAKRERYAAQKKIKRLTAAYTLRESRGANKFDENFTTTDYERLLLECNNICPICDKPPRNRRLAIDHDHNTGKVRGLVCGTCNLGLGHFKDDPQALRRAADYLDRHNRP